MNSTARSARGRASYRALKTTWLYVASAATLTGRSLGVDEFHSLSKRRKNRNGAPAENLLLRRGCPQPHSRTAIVSIDEFHARIFERPADGLIVGPGERGGARHQFATADDHLAFFLLSLA
jgi:hypothetical protein